MRTLLASTLIAAAMLLPGPRAAAQSQSTTAQVQQLQRLVLDLERRVAALEEQNRTLTQPGAVQGSTGPQAAAALATATAALRGSGSASALPAASAPAQSAAAAHALPALPGALPGGATLGYTIDGYYEYNFDQPWNHVNLLRPYDVSSNSFSLNQAAVVFDLDPDLAAHRRYGARLDLQFGQATATLQGNPSNESRPDVWRNVFQAYGTYIVPVGSGLHVDAGKWASSLGIEGNYTKDQANYSRSYFFNYLPYYHMGARASYSLNSKVTAAYWVVNGAQQTEDVNGFKDQLASLQLQPAKSLTWTINYYYGQEHPDTVPATNCTVPLQPGLCTAPVSPAPDGKLHIIDTYATWQASPKLTLSGEADYVIEREWSHSSPDHVDGGAAYAQYQFTSRGALAARGEYLSDRGGLFSDTTQALKEVTGTYKYSLGDGFDAFLEYRRDWSNRPYFITSSPSYPSGHQDTTALGIVWWYGGKQGSW